jgi:predicted RNA binding protein YcfA (HicA-like mRNA interferase family)
MKFPRDARKEKVIKALGELGFFVVRESNHIIMERNNSDGTVTPLVIPNHRTINSGTLRGILNQCNISREEFLNNFNK